MLKAFTTTIGAGTGFALGGPFGALIGAMGFVVGSALKGKKENGGQDQRQQESGN